MSEMADRIGRVIAFGMGTDETPENIARNVLKEMREPTDRMLRVSNSSLFAWEAMIDAC